LSAFLWALVTVVFKELGRHVGSHGINLGKSIFAAAFFSLALLSRGGLTDISGQSFVLLSLSGILGITFGDTLFFRSLDYLGATLSVFITALIPAATILLATTLLGERLILQEWIGVFLTLSGVIAVLMERSSAFEKSRNFCLGLCFGILTVLSCALAIICSKIVIQNVSVLEAAFIRQIAGLSGLLFLGARYSRISKWLKPFNDPVLLKKLVLAAFLGTFLGTLFSLFALTFLSASISTTLNLTGPIFILPISYYLLHEKVSKVSIIGALVTICGIALIFMR